jgi:hypothetical protein
VSWVYINIYFITFHRRTKFIYIILNKNSSWHWILLQLKLHATPTYRRTHELVYQRRDKEEVAFGTALLLSPYASCPKGVQMWLINGPDKQGCAWPKFRQKELFFHLNSSWLHIIWDIHDNLLFEQYIAPFWGRTVRCDMYFHVLFQNF